MTFLEALQAHKGGLVLLKTELWWYGGRGWDGTPGRVCLLLDAAHAPASSPASNEVFRLAHVTAAASTRTVILQGPSGVAGGLLLIDGRPRWVWVCADDLELL
jgi:hypothetical protein